MTSLCVTQCRSHQTRDYVEVLDGDGLDPTYMWKAGLVDICASTLQPSKLIVHFIGWLADKNCRRD